MEDTKTKILKAAESLISEKGLDQTTIASIAGDAGVADSLVYQYFKNKQDLLFSVAENRFEEALALLDEQLQGIQDPESRLRKLIWYGLRYNDLHSRYMRILLFECRSNKDFYASPAYQRLRRHAGILLRILTEGAASGAFCREVDMRLVRDMIYGVLDAEAVSRMAIGEIKESVADFDDIMALVLPMIQPRKSAASRSKEDRILAAAESAFSEKGFGKATILEIARRADVAEGTIYEYFKNKEDLLYSSAERSFESHLDELPELFHIQTPRRKLRCLVRGHFFMYFKRREFLNIFLTHLQYNFGFYQSRSFQVYRRYLSAIEQIIAEGQEDGSFRPDVNPRVFRNIFLGVFNHMAIRWVIVGKDRQHDKMAEIDRLEDLLAAAVATVSHP